MVTAADLKLIFFAIGTGTLFMGRAIKRRRLVQEITSSPRSRIASAPQGQVEIDAFAWPITEGILTPRDEEAIHYSIRIERKQTRGKRTEWVSVAKHSHSFPFYAVDATGIAIVEPNAENFEINDPETRIWRNLSIQEKAGVLRIVGEATGMGFPPPEGFWGFFSSEFRVVESEILLGSPVYLNGEFKTSHEESLKVSSQGLTEFVRRIFDVGSRNVKNLAHFLDKNRDGQVSEEEARNGYHFAAKTARARKPESGAQAESEFEVFGRVISSANHRLMVGDCHETYLTKRLDRFVWLQFVGGAAMISVGILFALSSFGVIERFKFLENTRSSSYRTPAGTR